MELKTAEGVDLLWQHFGLNRKSGMSVYII